MSCQCSTPTNGARQSSCASRGAAAETAFEPRVDLIERQDEFVLSADMPGVRADALDIQFEEGTLTVHGRVSPRWDEQARFVHAEYGVGDFRRAFRLGEQVDAAGISAELAHGVLTIHLPKVAAAKSRKIDVRVSA